MFFSAQQGDGPGQFEKMFDFLEPGSGPNPDGDHTGAFARHQGDMHVRAIGQKDGDPISSLKTELMKKNNGQGPRCDIVIRPSEDGSGAQIGGLGRLLATEGREGTTQRTAM